MAIYLYEAIAEVIRAGGNIPMTIGDIAEFTWHCESKKVAPEPTVAVG